MTQEFRHRVIAPSRHFVHLSYAHVRPKYTSPESWLSRIAFVSGVQEKLTPFGPQTVIYNITYKGEIDRKGVRYLFPAFNRIQTLLPFGYNRLIKSLRPDIVIIHGLRSPWQLIMLRWTIGKNVKIICQHHADRPYTDFRKYIFRWADTYVDAYLFASIEQGKEWVSDRIHVVMGMSSIFYPEHRPKTGKTYLWIGDLDNNKDPLLVIRAFNEFAKAHSGIVLNMIYQSVLLEEQARQIAGPNIHFVGKVVHEDLQDWFNRSDFIVSTSHYESGGIAVCEALSCGCFPILTNIPSFRMITDNGRIGRLFEPGQEKDLLKALEETAGVRDCKEVIDHFDKELSLEANARKIMNVVDQL
jgi:glycosyltransferase involved in cell wall biosynthesis